MADKEMRDQNNIYFIHMNSEGTQEGGRFGVGWKENSKLGRLCDLNVHR